MSSLLSFLKRSLSEKRPIISDKEQLLFRINIYLCAGGLFNPEYMEHDKVRRLLSDCRMFLNDL
jgi:hypothetical protein